MVRFEWRPMWFVSHNDGARRWFHSFGKKCIFQLKKSKFIRNFFCDSGPNIVVVRLKSMFKLVAQAVISKYSYLKYNVFIYGLHWYATVWAEFILASMMMMVMMFWHRWLSSLVMLMTPNNVTTSKITIVKVDVHGKWNEYHSWLNRFTWNRL